MIEDHKDFNLENPRYRIVRRIGSGGMGHVYLAFDLHLQRDVAIKSLLPHKMPGGQVSEQAIRRFALEADILKKLHHVYIIEFIDYFIENEKHFIVMEYVSEGSMRKRIHDQRYLYPSPEVCRLGMRLASALTAAHDLGIIHRDIKPSNVLLPADGSIRLSDFGVARLKVGDTSDLSQDLTGMNQIPGTITYMSPECLSMENRADELSDIWALGVVFYEMLAGYPPFKGATNQETARMIREEEIPPIEGEAQDVWPALAEIIHRMLARDPGERYPSMRAVGATLEEALRAEGVAEPGLQASLRRLFSKRASTPPQAAEDATPEPADTPRAPASIWGIEKNHRYSAEYDNSLALVIAPGMYQDSRFAPHPQAVPGSALVARVLEQRYHFNVVTLTRQQATQEAVRRLFRSLQDTEPDDRVVIYWAGAARTSQNGFGVEMSFLAAADTIYDDGSTYLELEDLIDVRFIKAKHIMFIIDAPLLAPHRLATTPADSFDIDTAMRHSAVHLLAAGKQPVPTRGEVTLFTEQVLKGLYGRAGEPDGIISADTLGKYVTREINTASNGAQEALYTRLIGGEKGTLIFEIPVPMYLPQEVRMGVTSKYAVMRLNMVQVLRDFAQQPGMVQRAALTLLKKMEAEDESQSVKSAAAQVLQDLMGNHRSPHTGKLPPLEDSDSGLR
ncbi:MAG: protein kinase [Anaerolineae bacterium]|nr:protein kinase [Anaerolineae bacterium]